MTTRYSPRHSLSSLLSSESDLAEFQALQDSCAEAQARDIPPPYYVTTPVRRLSEATLALSFTHLAAIHLCTVCNDLRVFARGLQVV